MQDAMLEKAKAQLLNDYMGGGRRSPRRVLRRMLGSIIADLRLLLDRSPTALSAVAQQAVSMAEARIKTVSKQNARNTEINAMSRRLDRFRADLKNIYDYHKDHTAQRDAIENAGQVLLAGKSRLSLMGHKPPKLAEQFDGGVEGIHVQVGNAAFHVWHPSAPSVPCRCNVRRKLDDRVTTPQIAFSNTWNGSLTTLSAAVRRQRFGKGSRCP